MTLPSPASALCAGASAAPALVTEDTVVTYGELAERVAARAAELGPARRLVMITAGAAVEPIVTYLAALEARHPLMFVTDDAAGRPHRDALIRGFDPDVVAVGADDGWVLRERRSGTRHDLHPDLAMLASTSGSTGSPKLVRLSRENLFSNAAAIAEYLRLRPGDRAATTLPLQYCYGLSVVNSHLRAGASLLLTDRSVADEEFWTEFVHHRATSFAGVPYTFDLLEASGFEGRDLPSLRYITQAGGRLAPERVRRFARMGRDRGFHFFVMYGQTEATARMAYLPPEHAETAPDAIGRPIPGGTLRVDAEADAEAGELVYSGPIVMLGYAEGPADLALGRTVHELRTGDLARRRDDGLFQVVGRMSRFVKIYGLRVDLDELERRMHERGIEARTASVEERLLVFVRAERLVADAASCAASVVGVPAHAVEGFAVAEFPRTASGKPDTAALVRHALDADRTEPAETHSESATEESIRALYARLLARADATADDSFVALGGDSLSFVEVSLRLQSLLGRLPRDWPTRTPRELAEDAAGHRAPIGVEPPAAPALDPARDARTERPLAGRRWGWRCVDTAVVLRAAAIVLVVGSHADLFLLQGGAHLLLAVVGFNLARFPLAAVRARSTRLLRLAAQIAVPSVICIGAIAMLSGQYRATTALLVNGFLPAQGMWSEQWQFWFLEVTVWTSVGLAMLFRVPVVDLLERRAPFGFAFGALGLALILRFAVTGIEAGPTERYTIVAGLWLIAFGWAAARATAWWQRVLLSALLLGATSGFLGNPVREGVVIVGILVLLWASSLALPSALLPVVRPLAASSMFVYLTHWQVYPAWEDSAPIIGVVLSFAVGICVWFAYRFTSDAAARRRALTRATRVLSGWGPRPRRNPRTSDTARQRPEHARPRSAPVRTGGTRESAPGA